MINFLLVVYGVGAVGIVLYLLCLMLTLRENTVARILRLEHDRVFSMGMAWIMITLFATYATLVLVTLYD